MTPGRVGVVEVRAMRLKHAPPGLWVVGAMWLVGLTLLVASFFHGGAWALSFSLIALAVMVVTALAVWGFRRELSRLG